MIRTVIYTTLMLLSTVGLAQNEQLIDSLHHRLAIAKDERSRVHSQIDLCAIYRLGNTDSSVYYGQLAARSAQEINYPEGEILALSFMSITLGQVGNLSRALEMAFKALQIAKSNNLEGLTSPTLNSIGEIYIVLKDYPKALSYLQKQKQLYDKIEINEGFGYALYDIGNVYEETDQLDSARHYEQQALEFFRKIYREEPYVYKTLGNIEMKSGDRDKALGYYQKSLQIAIQNNERRASASAYNKIASFYKLIDRPDSGIYYARKGLEESELIFHKKTILEAATLLSEFYELKDAKESLRYLKIANTYKDSLFSTGNIQTIQALVDKEEEHQKEIEAAKIKYQNQLKQYALVAGLGILLLIASILYRNNRQKQKANKILEQTLSDLKSAQSQLIQSEKMASLGELTAGIAHEIQNPLNFVNNFSDINTELVDEAKQEMEKGKTDEVKAILSDLKDNEQKINHHGKRADAIVKGMLQHSRSSSGQKESTDINALADEYLRLAYHGLRAKDNLFNATTKTDFDDSIGKINIIPQDIGRVILNLINNAFYAVDEKNKQNKNGYEPTVSVCTKKTNGKVEIKIADNGNGIPQRILDKIFQPFFTTKPTGQGTGLGLSLSYDIIKTHGGDIRVNTKENNGSEFTITLPA
ncbi:MAG TPA: ATP-binding protein [Chitinophagaceae bacterium]|nr:ATP-binding protein [Chitinophagaceae bacterium]